MPAAPARETRNGRRAGAKARCACCDAWIISKVCSGFAVAARIGVPKPSIRGGIAPDFKLVIVVPGRQHAIVQQGVGDLRLPPGQGFRIGKIEVGADLVPELHPQRRSVGSVDEQACARCLFEPRVRAQQAGFDVGAQPDAMREITCRERLRVGKFVTVPIEDIALVADGGISRGQMERFTQDVMFCAFREKLIHPRLCVRRVGVAHGGAGISQAPFRHKRGPAG